jgi:hypothetical protein
MMRLQAKHLPERMLIEAVRDLNEPWRPIGVDRWTLEERFSDYPPKVVMAKLKSLTRRGLLAGCTCGCRGDFQITQRGKDMIV